MVKILIAEDEEPIANLIRMNLKKAGYACECAYDGQEAADRMEEGHYDLLLLDIMLPKINGYELMEYAKSIQLPVIFITAMDSTENKVKGLKMGAEDYLAKPFEIVELLARVEAVLRRCNKIGRMLHVLDETLTYEVDQIRIVLPDELDELSIEEGQDLCTLVTCMPYGINTHRLLVRGHRVENDATAQEVRVTADAMQIEPLYIAPIVAAPLLLILLILLLAPRRHR